MIKNMNFPEHLTTIQATAKLKSEGYNELPQEKPKTILRLIISVFTEPMFLLLIACGVTYFILGDKKEGVILLSSIVLISITTFIQEQRTEKTLAALKDLSDPKAIVIRDGEEKRIASREVVPGDLLVLQEGVRISADCKLVQTTNLEVDESLLTGESISVVKKTEDNIFSGTLVIKGTALGRVVATGKNTEIGKIGKSLQVIDQKPSLLQKETKSIVTIFASEAIILCILLVYVVTKMRGNFFEGLLSGLTLAMSAIPEEFPVILTIFLAFGAWRLSKHNVLTRRMPIIETLGAITTLCVDKTGTLTQNKMRLAKLFSEGDIENITEKGLNAESHEKYHKLLEYSFLAGRYDPFDPIEKELKHVLNKSLFDTPHIHKTQKLLKEFPLTDTFTAVTNFWEVENNRVMGASKGAPESIFKLCKINETETLKLTNVVHELGTEGYRVLAVAESKDEQIDTIEEVNEANDITKFHWEFLGLIAFEDPVKPTIRESLEECYTAGINVKVLTGDFPATAISVAKTVGLRNPTKVLLGSDIEKLSDKELAEAIKGVNVFSRVQPLQKLKIVRALLANGEVVAMTGDGVNDAPSLKEAHVGIAMGKRGTDVAREASSIVLLDDDFSSIVKGIKQGRAIYDNIKKAMRYVFAVHVPIAGMSLIPVLSGLPNFFYPIHILFLEMVIDPTSTIVFEAEPPEANIMRRNPRSLADRIFNFKSIWKLLTEGAILLLITFTVYYYMVNKSVYASGNGISGRGIAFIVMVLGNLFLAMINRRDNSSIKGIIEGMTNINKNFLTVALIVSASLCAIFVVPGIRVLFGF